jgi:fermentation-respiration switch protein FrsA (DUF1100 family)
MTHINSNDQVPGGDNKIPDQSFRRRIFFSAMRILAAVLIGLTIFLYFFQSRYLYRPTRDMLMTPADIRLPYEDITFLAGDGTELSGWFVPAEEPRAVVLFCHSNMGNISHYLDSVQVFRGLGLSSLIFDYRGYGNSPGRPTEPGTYLDAEAAWRYLVYVKQFQSSEIIIWGRSLGGAVAARLAANHVPRALIIESTFTSFPELAAGYYPYIPVRLIVRYDYNVVDSIGRVDCPVLIVHSSDDEVIPFKHGLKLFESAKEPKEFLEIKGNHNDGFLASGKIYYKGLELFFSGLMKSER